MAMFAPAESLPSPATLPRGWLVLPWPLGRAPPPRDTSWAHTEVWCLVTHWYPQKGIQSQGRNTTLNCGNEDDCNLKEIRQFLSQRMKSITVISVNEDDWILKDWRWLSFPGMKTTVISRNGHVWYLKEWRRLSFLGIKKTVIQRNKEDCFRKEGFYIKEWRWWLWKGM